MRSDSIGGFRGEDAHMPTGKEEFRKHLWKKYPLRLYVNSG